MSPAAVSGPDGSEGKTEQALLDQPSGAAPAAEAMAMQSPKADRSRGSLDVEGDVQPSASMGSDTSDKTIDQPPVAAVLAMKSPAAETSKWVAGSRRY